MADKKKPAGETPEASIKRIRAEVAATDPRASQEELLERTATERAASGLPPLERSYSIRVDGFTAGSSRRIREAFERAIQDLRRASHGIGGQLSGEDDGGGGYIYAVSDVPKVEDKPVAKKSAKKATKKPTVKAAAAKARARGKTPPVRKPAPAVRRGTTTTAAASTSASSPATPVPEPKPES